MLQAHVCSVLTDLKILLFIYADVWVSGAVTNGDNLHEVALTVISCQCLENRFFGHCSLNNITMVQIFENWNSNIDEGWSTLVVKVVYTQCYHLYMCWGLILLSVLVCLNIWMFSCAVGLMLRGSCHKLLISYFYPLIWFV